MPQSPAKKPLDGLRILDFTRVLAGPYCSALMADLGADIVKVEPPNGDDYRHIGPFYDDHSSAIFESVNRGKRSLVLDLAKDEDKAAALRLAAEADIVIENFRPGVADKLGIGWQALSKLNPRLIYASISGFGQQGPNALRPAYDIIVQAMSGIMSVTGEPDRPPTLIGESIADVVSGLFASWSILAAVIERHNTGIGKRIDVAMFDAMLALQPLVVTRALASCQAPQRVGNRHALSAPFGAFAARDGEFVLAVLNDKLFATLATLIGQPELAQDPRFTSDSLRLQNEVALRSAIESWSRRISCAEAVQALIKAGVPAAEILDSKQALESEQVRARPVLQEVQFASGIKRLVPEQPAHFGGAPRGGLSSAPRLGEHTDEILGDIAHTWRSQ